MRRVPVVAAWAAVGVGVIDIVSAITHEEPQRLRALTQVVPLPVASAASAATLVAGVLLVMLAHGLRRRKRRAWRGAVVLLLASTALHVAKGLDGEEAVVAFATAVGLLFVSKQFYAAGDPRTRWRAPVALVAMTATSFVLGMSLLAVRHGDLIGAPSLGTQARAVLDGLVGLGVPLRFRDEVASDVVVAMLGGLGAATALITAYLALRAPEPPASLSTADEARLRELVRCHGARDSLGYFVLRRDKAAVFSPTGKAAVSYRVVSGVMLASGDPVGDPEAWPGAIRAFLDECGRHAWAPAVIGCSELGGEVWVREADLNALELGDEAIIDVADFSLDGRAMRNVRQMVRRVQRAGYETSVRRVGDIDAAELDELRRRAAHWRGAEVERGFAMALGRIGDPGDESCVLVTATREGRLAALLHFVPWGSDGLSLDLMRRDRSADAGLNELMIVAALEAAPQLGVSRMSLNFAVFRSALDRGGRLGAGPVLRGWRRLLLVASRWFQIESLYRFNAKFAPRWQPRYVCYRNAGEIPRVALAALEAEAFLVWPHRWWQQRRQRRGSGTSGVTQPPVTRHDHADDADRAHVPGRVPVGSRDGGPPGRR